MCIQKIFCTSGSHQPARKIEAAVPVWKEKAERMTQKELRFPPKRFVALFIAYHDYLRVSCYTEIFFVERDVRYIAINNGAVKRTFDLCVAGNGPMRIAKTLKADKVLTTRAHYAKQKELTEKVKEEQQKVDIIFNFVGEIHLPTDLQTEQKEATKQKKTA